MPWPDAELYDKVNDGCAPPRAGMSENGTLKVATPVCICVEKLSPMPSILPLPCGKLIAWLVAPLLSPPPSGSESTLTSGSCRAAAALAFGSIFASEGCFAASDAMALAASIAKRDGATVARSCAGAFGSAAAGEAAAAPVSCASTRDAGVCACSPARTPEGAPACVTASPTPVATDDRWPSSARA